MTAALDIGRSDQHIATLQAVAKAAQDDARLRDSAFQLHRLTLGGADVACLCNANASPAPESVLTVWPDGSVATVPYDQVRRAIARSTPYALDTPIALKGMQVDLFADPDPEPPAPAEQKPASLQAITAFANQTADPAVRNHIEVNSLGVHDTAYAVVRLHAYATAQAGSNEDVNSLIQRARETLAIYNRGDVPAIPDLIAAERRGLWDPLRAHIGYSEVARRTEEQRANQALIDKHGELFELVITPDTTANIVRKDDAWWVVRAGGKALSPLSERDSDAGIRQRLDAANAELISRGPYLPQEEITTEDVLADTTPKVLVGNAEQQAAHRAAVAELKRRGVAYNSAMDRSAMLFQDTHGSDFILHLIENNQRVDAPVVGDEAGLFGGDRVRAIEWAASWLAGLRNTPIPAEAMGAVQEPPSEPTPEPDDSPASYLREQGLDVKTLDSDTIATLLISASLPQRYDLATWLATQRPDLREAVDAILLESSVFDYPEEPRAEPYYNRHMNVAECQSAEAQFHQDGAVAFELPGGRLLSIHPSAKHPGEFQSTTYDALSATGDLSYRTLDEAVREAIRGSKGKLLPWEQAEPRLAAIADASYITADRAGALYDALPANLTTLADIAGHVMEHPYPAEHSATEEVLNTACHVIHWLSTDAENSPATGALQNASREAARAWLCNLVEQVGRSHVDAYRQQVEATFNQLPTPSPNEDKTAEGNAPNSARAQKTRGPRKPRIEDFGEKIGGARKDEEYERRLSSPLPDDIKDITLGKHFPEPNYQKLVNDGYDAYTLALIKACRDEIPSKPRLNYKLKTWGEKVASLREIANDLLTKPDFAQRFKEGIVQRDVLAPIVDKARLLVAVGFPEITDLKKYSIKKTTGILEWKGEKFPSPGVTRYVVKEKHLWRDAYESWEDAAEHIKGRLADAAKKGHVTKLDVWQWRNTGEVVIGKKVAAGKYIELQGGFSSVKHARAYLKIHHDELQALLAAKKKLPPWRGETNRERVGIDHRNGVDVTGEQMQEVFGFRAGEFGNYVEQSTRQAHLNGAYDALMDLSLVLGIDPKAISLDGELAIAFGARGRGWANAHYEHEYRVINLTKNNGPGSLAHEWFHAMDWLLANQAGVSGPLTETLRDPNIAKQFDGRQETLKAFLAIGDAIRQTDLPKRCRLLDVTRAKSYYGTMRELAARCFEHYIHTRLQARGRHNDYLVNILDLGEDERSPFPHPSEISIIHGSFDNLLNTLQQEITDKGIALFRLDERPKAKVDKLGFYSPLENAIRSLPEQQKGTPEHILAMLKQAGAKQDEMEWLGLPEYMALLKNSISQQQLLDFVADHGVQVEEIIKHDATPAPIALSWEKTDNPEIIDNLKEHFRSVAEIEHLFEDTKIGYRIIQSNTGFYVFDNNNRLIVSSDFDAYNIVFNTNKWGEFASFDDASTAASHDWAVQNNSVAVNGNEHYTLAAGVNRRELLLTLPRVAQGHLYQDTDGRWGIMGSLGNSEMFDTIDQAIQTLDGRARDATFTSPHWPEHANILAHLHLADYIDPNGSKVLLVEGVRSDWHNFGRQFGYGLLNDVPDVPFKDTAWIALTLKRAVRIAAEEGYDQVTWTTGALQVDLTGSAINMVWEQTADGRYTVRIEAQPDIDPMPFAALTRDELVSFLGRRIADDIVAGHGRLTNGGDTHEKGRLLNIKPDKGSGLMLAIRDQIVSNVVNGILHTLDANNAATLQNTTINGMAVRSFPVTDTLRQQALAGLPLFRFHQSPSDNLAQLPEIDRVIQDFQNETQLPIKAVWDVTDLPYALQRQVLAVENANTAVRGAYWNNTLYIVRRNHTDAGDVLKTLLHEGLAHYGLRRVFGAERVDTLMDDIYTGLNTTQREAVVALSLATKLDMADTEQRRRATEEYVAYLAEHGTEQTLVQKVVGRVREWLRELGWLQRVTQHTWTDNDITTLLRDVRRNLRNTPSQIEPREPTTANTARFRLGGRPQAQIDELGFYSPLENAILSLPENSKGRPDQVLAHLRQAGAKQAEIEWLGLPEYLAALGRSVNKQQLLDFVAGRGVRVQPLPALPAGAQQLLDFAGRRGVQVEEVVKRPIPWRSIDATWNETSDPDTARRLQRGMPPEARIQQVYANPDTGYHVVGSDDGYFAFDQRGRRIDPNHFDNYGIRFARQPQREFTHFEDAKAAAAYHRALQTGRDRDFARYTARSLPGGTNHREVLLTLQADPNGGRYGQVSQRADGAWQVVGPGEERQTFATHLDAYDELYRRAATSTYASIHWPADNNVIAHVRLADHLTPSGERVLVVNELQSDWNNAKRPGPRNLGRPRTPDMPFTGNAWVALAIKRVLRLAAEEGYTRIAWTTGDTQLARANLGKPLEEIFPQPGGDNPGPALKGKGLMALYDQIVPNTLKKMVRSLDPNNPAITPSEVVTPPLVINREWLAMMRDAADNHLFELSGHNRPDQEYQWQTFKNAIDAVALPTSGEWSPEQLTAHLREYDLPNLEALGLGDLAAEPPPGHTTVWSLPLSDELRRQARQGLPLFRFHDRAPVNPRHWPDIERLIGDFQAETGIPIVVVAHTQDLPEPLRQQALEAETEHTAARGAVWSGRLYLVHNNHADAADALATLLHEGVAHYGLRRVFGPDRVDALLDDIYTGLGEPQRQALAALAHRARLNIGDLQQRRRAVEEYVAEIAERGTEQTLMQRIVGSVREWLRELGWLRRVTQNTWSDNDITTLLSNVRRALPAIMDETTQPLPSEPLVQGVAENTAAYAPNSARIAETATSPGPGVQGDLFLAPGASPAQKQQQLTDIYHVLVEAQTTDHLKSDIEFIHDPKDLARLVADIGQRAQEVLLAVVADDEGEILRVIKHSSGTITESEADPLLIAAEAASIAGAASIHLAHNHPSGIPTPSDTDKHLTLSLANALDGTAIELGYHVVIGANTFHAFDATHWETVAPLPPKTTNPTGQVAVTERRFRRRNPGQQLHPSTTAAVVAGIESDHAVLLLNTQKQPVGIVFLSAQELLNLRQNGTVNRLLSAIHATNASAAILKTDDEDAASNLIRFFNRRGLRHFELLDWIDVDGTSALREAPEMLRHKGPFFSRGQSTKESYEARINALFADGQASRMGVKVLDSADVLGLLGYDNRPVHIAESKVIAGLHNHPLMTAEHWRRVPEWLENPVAVFDSDTVPGRLVFIAPEFIGTSPITLIVDPNATVGGQPVTLLLNAYERGTAMPLSRWINEHKLRYIDNEKIPAFNDTSGRQLPRVYRQTQGSRVKVYTDRHLVKFRQQKRSQATGVVVNPHPPESLRAELERAFPGVYAALENNGLARIVTSEAPEAKAAITGAPGSATRAYVERGTLVFIADHIARGYHIAGLMLHEIGVHLKQLGKDDGEFQTLLQAFEAMRQAGNERVMAAFAAVPGDTDAELVTEEALGHYLEQNSDQPFAQKVFTWLRAKLREWANVIDRSERFAITRWANRLQENDLLYLATAAVRSSVAANAERSPIAATAPATGEHSADAARLARGEAMGFDTQKVWYHGGFEDFAEFSPAQSGSGVYHFAESAQFADDYARSRAFHEASDADVVVRGFHLPKQLFDFANPEHIEQLRAILPEQLAIESKYGLNALAGPVNYSNAELLKAIQGIQTPYTPITADVLADIEAGQTELWLEGSRVRIIRCDHDRGEVRYVPVWQALQLDEARHEWQRVTNNPDASDWDRGQAEEALEHAEKVYRITTDPIAPAPRSGHDNWEILESEQLRPYLRQLGFEGCLMQEKGQRTACVFDPHRIRLENAAFDPQHLHDSNLLFRLAGEDKSLDMSEAARMQRAREMGFATDKVFYHGTTATFDAFDLHKIGSGTGAQTEGYGFYFSSDIEFAKAHGGSYVSQRGATDFLLDQKRYVDFRGTKSVYVDGDWLDISDAEYEQAYQHALEKTQNYHARLKTVYLKLQGDFIHISEPMSAQPQVREKLERLGFDVDPKAMGKAYIPRDAMTARQMDAAGILGVYHPLRNGRGENYVMFNPANIRSVDAAFDPQHQHEPNLLFRLADHDKTPVPGELTEDEKLHYLAAIAQGVDVSETARLERARQMGFDTDTVWYHGSPNGHLTEISESQTSYGLFFARDPETARYYTGKEGRLYAVYLKAHNVADLDDFETFKKIADNSIDITETRDDEDARHFGVRLFNEGYQKNPVIKAFFDKLEGIEEVLAGDYDAGEWLWNHDIGTDEIEQLVADIGLEQVSQQFDEDVPINRPELDDAWNVYQSGSQDWYQFYQSDFLRGAQQLGYDAVDMADPSPTGEPFSRVVFEPSQIRSVNALFEREFSDEPELMYRLADNSAVPNNLPLEEKLEYLAANAKQLDLSHEARMQRAKIMGFDTTTTWYHGTGRDFAAFEIDPQHKVNDAGVLGAGVYFSSDPTIASAHANLADPYAGRVIPAYLKIRNPLVVKAGAAGDNRAEGFYGKLSDLLATFRETYPDADYRLYETLGDKYDPVAEFIFGGIEDQVAQDIAELLSDFEHDAVLYEFDDGGKEVVVFDPSQIRSVNAAFDPDFSAHADLLFRLNEQTAAERRRLAEIEQAIDDFLREVDLPVVAVSRTRDLPACIRNAMKGLKNADTRMQAATYNGVIYLVKENHSDADDVRKTLLHEGVAHYGLRKVFGHARVNALMDDIYAGLNDEQRNDMRAVAIREQLDINNPDQRRTLTEEYVAYIAESGIEQTLLQKALATVRQWARELGWVSAWSDNDIKGLLRNTHRQLRKDTWRAQHNQPAEKPASLLLNARTAAAQPLYRQRDNLAFDDWFKHSQACDRSGKPLVVYRGQHGEPGVLETRQGSLSFSSAQQASQHALAPSADKYGTVAPHVLPVHLAINNPLINAPDNPFIDGAALTRHLGADRARVIALRFDNAIRGTEVWQTHYGNHGSVADLLKAQPEAIHHLQIPTRLVLDDPAIAQWLKNAGCDGAIYGVVEPDQTITPEYRVFDDLQVRSAFDPDQPFAQRPGHHPFVSAVEELGYFSVLHRAAQALSQPKGTPAQMLAMLKNAGVKEEELEWTDLREYLATLGERVTKQQIVDYVAGNGVRIHEIVKGFGHPGMAELEAEVEALENAYTEDNVQLSSEYQVEPSAEYIEEEAKFLLQEGICENNDEAYQRAHEAWEQTPWRYDVLLDHEETDLCLHQYHFDGDHECNLIADDQYQGSYPSLEDAKRAALDLLVERGVIVWRGDRNERLGELEDLAEAGIVKFADLTLPNGKNYREVLLTLPNQRIRRTAVNDAWEESGLADLHREQYPGADPGLFKKWLSDAVDHTADEAAWTHNGGLLCALFPRAQVRRALTFVRDALDNAGDFVARDHWDEKNIIAHVRLTDRSGPNGEKILFIEELQSDWHQQGRQHGYSNEPWPDSIPAPVGYHFEEDDNPEESGVAFRLVADNNGQVVGAGLSKKEAAKKAGFNPDNYVTNAPFKNNGWVELALKRVLRLAAEGGYDQVAWTPGAVQANRNNLFQYIDKLKWSYDIESGRYAISALKNGHPNVVRENQTAAQLRELVGKDIALKIQQHEGLSERDGNTLQGLLTDEGLTVDGSKGMATFYDQLLPNTWKKIARRLDKSATVTTSILPNTLDDKAGKTWKLDPEPHGGRYLLINEKENRLEQFATIAEAQAALIEREQLQSVTVWAAPITDAMRVGAMQGQPLFRLRAEPEPAPVRQVADNVIRLQTQPPPAPMLHDGTHLYSRDDVQDLGDETPETIREALIERFGPAIETLEADGHLKIVADASELPAAAQRHAGRVDVHGEDFGQWDLVDTESRTLCETYLDARGEERTRRVGDWANAEVSAGSGQPIVHIYWCRHKTSQQLLPFGSDTAAAALGLRNQRTLAFKREALEAEKSKAKSVTDQVLRDAQRFAAGNPADAIRGCLLRNRHHQLTAKEVTVLQQGERFIGVVSITARADTLAAHGWRKLDLPALFSEDYTAGSPDPGPVTGYFDGGTCYLVASHLTAHRAPGVLLHEMAHAALPAMLGQHYGALVTEFNTLLEQKDPYARLATALVPPDTLPENVDAERLAYLVELVSNAGQMRHRFSRHPELLSLYDNLPQPTRGAVGLVERVYSHLRAWLFRQPFYQQHLAPRLGRFGLTLTATDIQSLAYQGLRRWADGLAQTAPPRTAQQFSFAGELATGADLAALDRAREMRAKGRDRNDIWQETGWFKDVDGRWKFEIDDTPTTLVRDAFYHTSTPYDDAAELLHGAGVSYDDLSAEDQETIADIPFFGAFDTPSNVLANCPLLDHYPELDTNWLTLLIDPTAEKISGRFQPGVRVSGSNEWSILPNTRATTSDFDEMRRVLLHEMQHHIQEIEGFGRGADSKEIKTQLIKLERERMSPHVMDYHAYPAAAKKLGAMQRQNRIDRFRAIANMARPSAMARYITSDQDAYLLRSDIIDRFGLEPPRHRNHERQQYLRNVADYLAYHLTQQQTDDDKAIVEQARLDPRKWHSIIAAERQKLWQHLNGHCAYQAAWKRLQRYINTPAETLYTLMAGEVEARNVEYRSKLSTAERALYPPWTTIDVEAKDIIVEFANFGYAELFVGPNAKGVDTEALELAKKLDLQDVDRNTIWQKTGWGRGPDGGWRTEIDDRAARLRQNDGGLSHLKASDPGAFRALRYYDLARDHNGYLSEHQELTWRNMLKKHDIAPPEPENHMAARLRHPQLFARYPAFKHASLYLCDSATLATLGHANGAHLYYGSLHHSDIAVNQDLDSAKRLAVTLHETQHRIQAYEHWARGGSAREFKPQDITADYVRELQAKKMALFARNPEYASLQRAANRAFGAICEQYGEDPRLDWNKVPDDVANPYFELLVRKDAHPEACEYIELDMQIRRLMRDRVLLSPEDQYQRLVGEVEANNVIARMRLSPAERRTTPPWETAAVAEKEQIIRFYPRRDNVFFCDAACGGADQSLLDRAKALHRSGMARDAVFRETGCFQSPDGRWCIDGPHPGRSPILADTLFADPALHRKTGAYGLTQAIQELPNSQNVAQHAGALLKACGKLPALEERVAVTQALLRVLDHWEQPACHAPAPGARAKRDAQHAPTAATSPELNGLADRRQNWERDEAATPGKVAPLQ